MTKPLRKPMACGAVFRDEKHSNGRRPRGLRQPGHRRARHRLHRRRGHPQRRQGKAGQPSRCRQRPMRHQMAAKTAGTAPIVPRLPVARVGHIQPANHHTGRPIRRLRHVTQPHRRLRAPRHHRQQQHRPQPWAQGRIAEGHTQEAHGKTNEGESGRYYRRQEGFSRPFAPPRKRRGGARRLPPIWATTPPPGWRTMPRPSSPSL